MASGRFMLRMPPELHEQLADEDVRARRKMTANEGYARCKLTRVLHRS
ncbi:MAG: HicB family, partial [Proteobacteria bacterium]|nr:HicB family [Pseudomonadota bacterium]